MKTLKAEIRELLEKAFLRQAQGCCGAGRHMIVRDENGELGYLHDSAQERIGADESHVVWAMQCSREDARFEADTHDKEEMREWASYQVDSMDDEQLAMWAGIHPLDPENQDYFEA